MKNQILILSLFAMVVLAACKKDKPEPETPSGGGGSAPYASGVFVSNEGPFSSGSGSVYFYNPSSQNVTAEIFSQKNGRPVGSILQSTVFHNLRGYLSVNNGAKVEVVNANDFNSITTISGFVSPRYFEGFTATKGYVSDWGLGGVAVVDLGSNTIAHTITTGNGPEGLLIKNDRLFVTNTGNWSVSDNTVTVIHAGPDTIINQLQVGDKPNSVVEDKNGKLWVLCSGISDWQNPANDTEGSLYRIDPLSLAVEAVFTFPNNWQHPTKLAINGAGNKLYYLSDLFSGGICAMDISATTLPATPLVNRTFYGMGVSPSDGHIYGADPKDYVQNGWIFRYDPAGSLIDSFEVGVAPGHIAFR